MLLSCDLLLAHIGAGHAVGLDQAPVPHLVVLMVRGEHLRLLVSHQAIFQNLLPVGRIATIIIMAAQTRLVVIPPVLRLELHCLLLREDR